MQSDETTRVNTLARVPEHSVAFMQAMSGGEPFTESDYFFLAADDQLWAVAYPLRGKYSHDGFEAALHAALVRSGAAHCLAVGPDLPPRLHNAVIERDRFYILPAKARVPAKLHGPVRRAAKALRVKEGREFTPAHRRLWAEFLGRTRLASHVRELYARAPEALASAGKDLRLLNAFDKDGNLAACLLLDFAPEKFCSYILGAHSRLHYTPHAADLLFAVMAARSRRRGKRYVHLGLGVNEGITRFKRKWGGRPWQPFVMAAWEEQPRAAGGQLNATGFGHDSTGQAAAKAAAQTTGQTTAQTTSLLLSILRTDPNSPLNARRVQQRPFAMLWEVRKGDSVSWLAGSAHFFRYSFENSFVSLFEKVHTVLFEGPLDEDFLSLVDLSGKTVPPEQQPLFEMLTEEEIRRLERVVRGPEGPLYRFLNMEAESKTDVRWFLRRARPWCAFFSLWTGLLERLGCRESVDMEAWRIAGRMGKTIIGMESPEEQIAALEAVPLERVLRFFRDCHSWKTMMERSERAYLAGDLHSMVGCGAEFPTRTGQIISKRDQRFRERMRPYLEAGNCVVFVGAAHVLDLRGMLTADGFSLRRAPFGLGARFRARRLDRKEARS